MPMDEIQMQPTLAGMKYNISLILCKLINLNVFVLVVARFISTGAALGQPLSVWKLLDLGHQSEHCAHVCVIDSAQTSCPNSNILNCIGQSQT